MMEHDIVNGPHCTKLSLQFVKVGFEHLNLHVVHIVFAKLEHPVPQGICLLQNALYVTFLSGLVLEPDLLKVLLRVLALE